MRSLARAPSRASAAIAGAASSRSAVRESAAALAGVGASDCLRRGAVVVEHAAEPIAPVDLRKALRRLDQRRRAPGRWALVERAVRPVLVVVADVLARDALEVSATEDQRRVEALAAQCLHPALGMHIRSWRAHRRPDD